jgi:hypothetical protein
MMAPNNVRIRRVAVVLIAATMLLAAADGCTQSKVDPFEPWNA